VAWSPRDTVSLTRTGFTGNPVGFRAVKMIAEAAAALPLVLQDAERRYDSHPVLDLISRPNAAQGRAELMEAVHGQLHPRFGSGSVMAAAPAFGLAPLPDHATSDFCEALAVFCLIASDQTGPRGLSSLRKLPSALLIERK